MAETALSNLSAAEYKKRIRAWAMYDWANSAFATTILAAVLPVYYSGVAGANLASAAKATQYWNITLSISVFIVAIISPILGTVSDIKRGKKKFLSVFIAIGVVGTGLMMLINTGDWLMASVFFILGRVGFAAANVFYDALLPHVAKEEDLDRVSTMGYALGYLGGGILLAINIVMIFTIDDSQNWGVRLSFLTVAIWWVIFSIPLFRTVPEPPSATEKLKDGESLVRVTFARLRHTLGQIREYRELFRFLIAFLIYNDGIGIIISVAAIYGKELGFPSTTLILAILLVQFVGIPFSIVFGNISNKEHKRQRIFTAFIIFNILALPLVGILGRLSLPQVLSGTPSPDFATEGAFVGQGKYTVDGDAIQLAGNWAQQTVSGEERGEKCSWIDFGCEVSELELDYATSAESNAQINVPFNGQPIEITYSTGPDRGIWALEIDGEPVMDGTEPLVIDAYNAALRYDVTEKFDAPDEGQHTLSIISSGEKNAASSGNTFSLAKVEVKAPLRTNSLATILIILIILEAVGWLFAITVGKNIFKKFAAGMDTKRAITLALVAYAIIAVWGFFLNSVIEFWFLAWLVAVVQGGSQGLSRSLYADMTPQRMSGEFFGLFSIMSKFASFLSPLLFVISIAIWDSSRPGILSLLALFVVGGYLLSTVDVEAGRKFARKKNAELGG